HRSIFNWPGGTLHNTRAASALPAPVGTSPTEQRAAAGDPRIPSVLTDPRNSQSGPPRQVSRYQDSCTVAVARPKIFLPADLATMAITAVRVSGLTDFTLPVYSTSAPGSAGTDTGLG